MTTTEFRIELEQAIMILGQPVTWYNGSLTKKEIVRNIEKAVKILMKLRKVLQ